MEPEGRAPDHGASASRARDHLANERTFLAWVRTALGLIGLGFVLARMGLFLEQLAMTSLPGGHRFRGGHEFIGTGIVFLVLGTIVGGWSVWLYQRRRLAIDAGRFEPDRATVLALGAVVVVGGLAVIGLVLWRTSG
jgi:putative membrane protein